MTSEPLQARTVLDWRKAKESACQHSLTTFGDTIKLAELSITRCLAIHEAVQPINGNDDRLLLDFMLLGTHRLLLNSLSLLVERQNLEAMAVLRPAIEMAADAAKIGRNPELSRVWLQRDQDKGTFDTSFRRRFPRGDNLTGPLYLAYGSTCDFGSHSNANLFVLQTTVVGEGAKVHSFLPNDAAIRLHLVHWVVTTGRILDVYEAGLRPITKKDLTGIRGAWQSAVDVHREKYRELFVKIE